MKNTTMHTAQLNEARLERLRKLEAKLGTTIVALEPDPAYANLSDEQIKELQAAENELKTVLVAYERT